MQRDEPLAMSPRLKELKSFGVKSLALLGSVVRNEAEPDSDVDLLVEFEGLATFDR